METLEKIIYPVAAVGAIVGLYIALKKPNVGPTQSNQISPQASGLPNYTPQAVSYQVNPPHLAEPTQLQLLSNPNNPNPALPPNPQYQTPPAYLAFNFGPATDLSKIPLTDAQIAQLNGNRQKSCGNCGCGSNYPGSNDCTQDPNKSIYPDGRQAFMAPTGKSLVGRLGIQDPSWVARAGYNLSGSDIVPETLPFPNQGEGPIGNPMAGVPFPNQGQGEGPIGNPMAGSVPTAPNQTLSVSSPGSNVVNQPTPNSAVNPNIRGVNPRAAIGQLHQFGNQALTLSAEQISRITGIPFGPS